jgi:hypothetical protein
MLLLALVLAAASPAPSPPPLKTIIRLRASPTCSALHNLVLPLARVHQRNAVYLTSIKRYESKYIKYAGSIFEGGRMLYAANIDQAASNIVYNLHQMDRLLRESYESLPPGKNSQVDAMRQRVQNIVDVERAIANTYIKFAGGVVDAYGNDELDNAPSAFGSSNDSNTTGGLTIVSATPFPGMPGSGGNVAFPPELDPRISNTPPPSYTARDLKYSGIGWLQTTLQSEGRALIPQAMAAAEDCDGIAKP